MFACLPHSSPCSLLRLCLLSSFLFPPLSAYVCLCRPNQTDSLLWSGLVGRQAWVTLKMCTLAVQTAPFNRHIVTVTVAHQFSQSESVYFRVCECRVTCTTHHHHQQHHQQTNRQPVPIVHRNNDFCSEEQESVCTVCRSCSLACF